jgi:hypothetical protein
MVQSPARFSRLFACLLPARPALADADSVCEFHGSLLAQLPGFAGNFSHFRPNSPFAMVYFAST